MNSPGAKDTAGAPTVRCVGCGRVTACTRASDGTTYKPPAWQYPDKSEPMGGICGGCQKVGVLVGKVVADEVELLEVVEGDLVM